MQAPVRDVTSDVAFVLRPHVVATVIDDGAVLLDLQSKFFYRLNSSAWFITQLFEMAGATRADIQAKCQAGGASQADMDEITHLIESMHQYELVEATADRSEETVNFTGPWQVPVMERQAEPLHRVITSAFDPSVPLAE
ncbi:MAG: hypothetical protein GIW98_04125 [Candidatus Eremiobacteraeota bacterium]|nr:hypothetical protein [Candidatus Eremiobacteraeota bacterium]